MLLRGIHTRQIGIIVSYILNICEVNAVKEIPILYDKKEECCGCTACYAICPKDAIVMIEDEEGFEYPRIDESKCIRCYTCLRVCPFKD